MTRRGRTTAVWTATSAMLLLMVLLDLHTGSFRTGFRDIVSLLHGDMDATASVILLKLRLPRIATAVTAGAALAVCGALMQAVFRNSLADPHILGISAGAGTGVAALTLAAGLIPQSGAAAWLADSGIGMTLAAGMGAVCVSLLMMWISTRVRQTSALLIAGVMTGFIMSALTSIMEYQADESRLKAFWSWSAGCFSGNSWNGTAIMAAALAIGTAIAISQGKGLSVMLFGDDYAAAAGVDTGRVRTWSMLGCCVMTGTVTAFCGPIGFIGIVAPHAARILSGKAAMRTIMPLSMMTGALISVCGDWLSQIPDSPLPVGSTIALIGIPLLFVLIRRFRTDF